MENFLMRWSHETYVSMTWGFYTSETHMLLRHKSHTIYNTYPLVYYQIWNSTLARREILFCKCGHLLGFKCNARENGSCMLTGRRGEEVVGLLNSYHGGDQIKRMFLHWCWALALSPMVLGFFKKKIL